MKKIFTPERAQLAVMVIAAIAVTIFWLRQPSTPAAPASTREPATTDPARLFEQSVDCAALMAAMESSLHGRLAPESPVFSLIGYTLGYAQEQAGKAKLDPASVRPAYDLKVITYYQQFTHDPEGSRARYREHHARCIATARRYDPHTLLQAAFEDARNGQNAAP